MNSLADTRTTLGEARSREQGEARMELIRKVRAVQSLIESAQAYLSYPERQSNDTRIIAALNTCRAAFPEDAT